jgi:hypothetical protein
LERQAAIDALCEHFAADRISMEEFERRVDQVNAADSLDQVRAALAGLPDQGVLVPEPVETLPATTHRRPPPLPATAAPGPMMVPPEVVKERQWIVAIWSGPKRTGQWTPARQTVVTAVQGGAELDFREARFGPGVTEVTAVAIMGGIDIIVPPGLQVEVNGVGVMGSFEASDDLTGVIDPAKPILRVGGVAMMGAVEVTMRDHGETGREAKRRRKLARKEIRKRLRGR